MTTMKINITPEMRIRMMQAETIEIDVPDTQAEFVGLLRQQLLTQNGRCTADPFFVVFSKQEIVVDSEYDHDRIIWWHKDDHIEACERATRWLDYRENTFRDTGDWVKLAIKEIDQFETACFTEQGCKDYIEANGHNLRKPFIYVHSLYRNQEMLELRKMLMVELAEEAVRAKQVPAVPDGWQLVPVSATKAMWAAWDSAPCNGEDDAANLEAAYGAMLAAAPKLGGE